MKTRWGSLSSNSLITLNLRLIQTPRECIEYVIMHELCHLEHNHHSEAFFKLLSRRMPDWKTRKQKLELFLI
jgi:predicted metal-dependent hydrolase